jgi:hypothetical protein
MYWLKSKIDYELLMKRKEYLSYMLFDKSQISIVLSLTQKNIVADFGDQIASKNTFEFNDENIIED